VLFGLLRKRFKAIFYIVGAGVLFGFVATLAKVVIDRVKTIIAENAGISGVEWLTVACIVGLLTAALLGSYFVQSAYSSGPPDLVVAGLTVIDPLVAVLIGVIVLGEAASAPLWAVIAFVIAGTVAIFGVIQLSRHHPQVHAEVGL
jgi:drug/metabolite transporter (DMT)-like permease